VAALTGDLLSRAIAAHQQGDRVQAESLYRRVLSKEKRNTDALHYFGLLQAENERWDEAAQLLREAIRFGERIVGRARKSGPRPKSPEQARGRT